VTLSEPRISWAMEEWLKTKALNNEERAMIHSLGSVRGIDAFKRLSARLWTLSPDIMKSAIGKARAEGIGRSWKV
jgi:uridine phosphorylase